MSESDSTTRSLFAQFVQRAEADECPDFEEVCSEHPDHAEGLRQLKAKYDDIIDALGRTSLKASFAKGGRVEDWCGGSQDHPWLCPGFPPSCPHRTLRSSVSSPLRLARSVRISRTTRSYTLLDKGYETYHAGAAFAEQVYEMR
jgi:hypothetical protein